MPRCAGISNGSPNRSRRRASCALTAGWLRCRRRAARVTFCSASKVSRVTSKFRSSRLVSIAWIVDQKIDDFTPCRDQPRLHMSARVGAPLRRSRMSRFSSLPLITVAGASSKQGRSVAGTLLDSGRYRVRALARSSDSAPMRELAQRGAEIVVAPLEAGRQAELAAAMRGSYGAFLMTPPIAPVPPPGRPELALGVELADAALAAGVQHVVWSSLENVDDRTGGTLWAPHFTEKALVE